MSRIGKAGVTHANLTAGNSKSSGKPRDFVSCVLLARADASSPEEPGAIISHAGICEGAVG